MVCAVTEHRNYGTALFQVCSITKVLVKERRKRFSIIEIWEMSLPECPKPATLAAWEAEAGGLQAQGPSEAA